MDLYIQVGVLFIFLTTFAIVASVNSDMMDMSRTANDYLSSSEVDYKQESSMSDQQFQVDARNLKQWVFNASDQSDVYLDLSSAGVTGTFNNTSYDAYKYKVTVTPLVGTRSHSMVVDYQATSGKNMLLVTKGNWQSERAIELFSKTAKTKVSRTVTVLSIADDKTGKLSYVVRVVN